MPLDPSERYHPKHSQPSSRYPPSPPSGDDKPKEKRNPMLLIATGLMVFNSVVITVMIETSRLNLPFCASGLAALNTAIIALSHKIIMRQGRKK